MKHMKIYIKLFSKDRIITLTNMSGIHGLNYLLRRLCPYSEDYVLAPKIMSYHHGNRSLNVELLKTCPNSPRTSSYNVELKNTCPTLKKAGPEDLNLRGSPECLSELLNPINRGLEFLLNKKYISIVLLSELNRSLYFDLL